MSKPTLSACLIVKNEEPHLADCLSSIQTCVDEIIIVDTGSSDGTLDIARRYTDKIYAFDWCDDFAAARNESLKYATQDWILVIDADERLTPQSASVLPQILAAHTDKGPVLLNALVHTPHRQSVFTKALFPNHVGIAFKGCVHEWPAVNGVWLDGISSPLVFHHAPVSSEQLKTKFAFYDALIHRALKNTQDPKEKVVYHKHAGTMALEVGKTDVAWQHLQAAYEGYGSADRFHRLYLDLLKPLYHLSLAVKDDLGLAHQYAHEMVNYFPDYIEGQCYFAYTQFFLDQLSSSVIDALEQRISLLPHANRASCQSMVTLLKARVAILDGDVPTGIALLNDLFSQSPRAEIALHLSRAYFMRGDREQATVWYLNAHQVLPLNAESLLALDIWSPAERQTIRTERMTHV